MLAASDEDMTAAAAAAADVRAATAATDAMTPRKLPTEQLRRLFDAVAVEDGGFGLVPFILRSNSDVESGATCWRCPLVMLGDELPPPLRALVGRPTELLLMPLLW